MARGEGNSIPLSDTMILIEPPWGTLTVWSGPALDSSTDPATTHATHGVTSDIDLPPCSARIPRTAGTAYLTAWWWRGTATRTEPGGRTAPAPAHPAAVLGTRRHARGRIGTKVRS